MPSSHFHSGEFHQTIPKYSRGSCLDICHVFIGIIILVVRISSLNYGYYRIIIVTSIISTIIQTASSLSRSHRGKEDLTCSDSRCKTAMDLGVSQRCRVAYPLVNKHSY